MFSFLNNPINKAECILTTLRKVIRVDIYGVGSEDNVMCAGCWISIVLAPRTPNPGDASARMPAWQSVAKTPYIWAGRGRELQSKGRPYSVRIWKLETVSV